MYNGTSWVDMHTYVYTNGAWLKLPNWKPAVTRPTTAMTSENSANCVATASTRYGSEYASYMAFDKKTETMYGWVSESTDTAPWIQLKMDVSLLNIKVTIVNRKRSSLINGIISGVIKGSDDGVSWVDIGTISNRDGATSLGSTTHQCNNNDHTYSYIRINITNWSKSSDAKYVAVGEIYIDGYVEK